MRLKPKLFKIYKRIGETPLEAIDRIREQFPDFSAEKMTYAGRLDPLAEGVLLILVGDECKNKETYLGYDKEYEVEILLGVKTDTGDLMGLIELENGSQIKDVVLTKNNEDLENKIRTVLNLFLGKRTQAYPKFSSPKLCGKKDIFKEIEIKQIDFIEQRIVGPSALLDLVMKKIALVKGDFRQMKIIEKWKKILAFDQQFVVVKCRVFCTSGTYIRVLAEDVGRGLGFPACVYSLKRTK